jgi:endonuclease YncB( thermonuclease family)
MDDTNLTNLPEYQNTTLSDQNKLLLNATYKNTSPFTIKDTKGWAKVVKVYDGDTCHIAFTYKGEIVRLKCRIVHIDTAEMRSKDPREKAHAIKAKKRLLELINATDNGLVWVHIKKEDLYGRFLTGLYADDTEELAFHEVLVEEGLAYGYEGRKKSNFDDWYPVEKVDVNVSR